MDMGPCVNYNLCNRAETRCRTAPTTRQRARPTAHASAAIGAPSLTKSVKHRPGNSHAPPLGARSDVFDRRLPCRLAREIRLRGRRHGGPRRRVGRVQAVHGQRLRRRRLRWPLGRGVHAGRRPHGSGLRDSGRGFRDSAGRARGEQRVLGLLRRNGRDLGGGLRRTALAPTGTEARVGGR